MNGQCSLNDSNIYALLNKLLVPGRNLDNTYKEIGKTLVEAGYDLSEDNREHLAEAMLAWRNAILPIALFSPGSENQIYLSALAADSKELQYALTSIIHWDGDTKPEDTKQMDIIDQDNSDNDTIDITTRIKENQLDDIYQQAAEAKTLMQQSFKRNIVSSLLVNFKTGQIPTTAEQVNNNIASYKEELVKNIIDYANTYTERNITAQMYNEDGTLNISGYRTIEELAKHLFENTTDIELIDAFKMRNDSPKSRAFLDAFNSWIILNNFDMLIKAELKDSVNIKKSLLDAQVDKDVVKYQLIDESELVKTWRNSEDVNALKELGNITTLLISSTPMYDYNKGNPYLQPGKYVDPNTFFFAFADILRIPAIKRISENKRYNSLEIIPQIIDAVLATPSLGPNTNLIHSIMYSVQQHFFRTVGKSTDQDYSLAEIILREQNSEGYYVNKNYLNYVASAIDKTIRNLYLTYNSNRDTGVIETRISTDVSASNSEFDIRNSIESPNKMLLPSQREQLITTYVLNNKEYYDTLSEEEQEKVGYDPQLSSYPSLWSITTDISMGGAPAKLVIRVFNDITSDSGQNNKSIHSISIVDENGNSSTIFNSKDGFLPDTPEAILQNVESVIMDMIDDTLKQNFKANPEFFNAYMQNLPNKETGQQQSRLEGLLYLIPIANRVLIKHTLEAKNLAENTSLLDKVYRIDPIYKFQNGKQKPYLSLQKRLKVLMDTKGDKTVVKFLGNAKMVITGEIAKSTSKNIEGNTVSNNGLTNLMSTVALVFEDSRKRLATEQDDSMEDPHYRNSCLRNCIFVLHPEFLHGVVQKQGAKSKDGLSSKLDKKFNVAESLESAIKFDFLINYGLDPSNSQQGIIRIQPTDYSDKTTDYLLELNGNIPIANNKSLVGMSCAEVEELHRVQMDSMYSTMRNNIGKDYHDTLFAFALANADILGLNPQYLMRLDQQADYSTYYNFYTQVVFKAINANINKLQVDGKTYTDPRKLYRDLARINNTTIITNVHFDDKAKVLTTNNIIDYYFRVFGNKKIYDYVLKRNQLRFIKDVSSYVNFRWSTQKGIDPILENAVKRLVSNGTIGDEEMFISNWVDYRTGDLILAKINTDEESIPLTKTDLKKLKLSDLIYGDNFGFEINPILRAFFAIDTMVSQQFISSTVGGNFVHKNNFGKNTDTDPLWENVGLFEEGTEEFNIALNEYLDTVEVEDAGRLLTQYKRMVIYPATMHPLYQMALEGVPTYYNIASIDDVQANTWDYISGDHDSDGKQKTIDAHDGSGMVDPGFAILENGSLQGAHVGIDKKPIGHSMDDSYMVETELKYALFAITNWKVRNSSNRVGEYYGINYDLIRRKMGSSEYGRGWPTDLDIDITTKFNGEKIDLDDLESTYFYDPSLKSYFQIVGIQKLPNVKNGYIFTYQHVDENAKPIGQPVEAEQPIIIDSNYSLWKALGGEWSCSLQDGRLVEDESSNYNWAYFANNIGFIRTKQNPIAMHEIDYTENDLLDENDITIDENGKKSFPTVLTQKDVYQPLKYSGIQYAVNVSGIKNGQVNTNPVQSHYDQTPLRSFRILTKHLGVQMNADHHADDAELTEMSQVISALEANGWAHDLVKQIYEDLGSIVLQTLEQEIQALKVFLKTGDNTEIYRIVGKSFIKSFGKDGGQDTLTASMMNNIIKELNGEDNIENIEQKIPFSDTSVLSSVVSNITSNINKTAIKRKYSGLAAVLVPAYDIIKIYKQKLEDGSTKDALNGDIIKNNTDLEIQTETGDLMSAKNIELGLSYIVYENTALNPQPLKRATIDGKEYYVGHDDNGILVLFDKYGNIQNISMPEWVQEQYVAGQLPNLVVTLDTINDYKKFKRSSLQFKEDYTTGRNLQPSKTSFQVREEEGTTYNIFDTDEIEQKIKFREFYDVFKKTPVINYRNFFNNNDALFDIINRNPNPRIVSIYTKIRNLTSKEVLTPNDDVMIQKYMDMLEVEFANQVVMAFQNLHEQHIVHMGGETFNVIPESIEVKPAELVVSKIYATKFGIRKGDNLNDIDLQYFIQQQRDNFVPKTELYDIMLRRDNGRHTYVLLSKHKDQLLDKHFVKVTPPTRVDSITGDVIRLNELEEDMMPFNNCELYVKDGIEVIVTDDPADLVDDAFEYSSYDINPSSKFGLEDLKIFDTIPLKRIALEQRENYINNLAQKKWTSFQQSLEFIAARIPAQALQSFMPMKVVGFTDSEENKAYVSHFQTYLQGSDYDIDKVYLMGNEFTESGIYIGWSPYFNLNSLQKLKISQEIPMPNGIEYSIVSNQGTSENTDITEDIINLKLAELNYGQDSVQYLTAIKNLLVKIQQSKNSELTVDYASLADTFIQKGIAHDPTASMQFVQDESDRILDMINKHSSYFKTVKNKDMRLKMTKNSVTSKMYKTANLPENTYAAYSPIEMGETREAATKSQMGEAEKDYTTFNPVSKFMMHYQNMMGKDGIGISAVGEKVLFCLQFYFNEAARLDSNLDDLNSDEFRYQRNAFFHKSLDIIASGTDRMTVIRNLIANINLRNSDHIWAQIINSNVAELESLMQTSQDKDRIAFLQDMILLQLNYMKDSSLVNSSLLSAATDNAKELILAKINANPDMMKVYTYGIILGIDFTDIANLMTSPTVNAVNQLSDVNIFEKDSLVSAITASLNSLKKGINPGEYLNTTDIEVVEDLLFKVPNGDSRRLDLQELIHKSKTSSIEGRTTFKQDLDKVNKGEISWSQFAAEWAVKINDIINLIDGLSGSNPSPSIQQLYRYLFKMQEWLDIVKDIDQRTLLTFKDMLDSAEEFVTFGAILGINQGIRTDVDGKLAYLNRIENVFKNRFDKGASTNVNDILAAKPYYVRFYGGEQEARNYIEATVKKADSLGIYNDFNVLQFLLDDEYRAAAIDAYDLIKGTINILDIISRVPHFHAMVDSSSVDFYLFSSISSVFNLMYNISHELLQRGELSSLSTRQRTDFTRDLQNFIQSQIALKYFKDRNVKVPIGEGNQIINKDGALVTIEEEEALNLGTIEGQAAFKLWMEQSVVPNLKIGVVEDGNDEYIQRSLLTNKFIQALTLNSTTRTTTGDEKGVISLPINMSVSTSEYNENMFVSYLTDFNKLKGVTYNGIPVQSLFFWYNLIVNRNVQSRDALTKIFKSAIRDNRGDNDINDYFKYVGDMDKRQLFSLEDFNMQDLLLSCAPKVTRAWLVNEKYESNQYPTFVKSWDSNTGTYKIYKLDPTTFAKRGGDEMDDLALAQMEDAGELDYETNEFTPVGYREYTISANMSKAVMVNLYPFLPYNSQEFKIKDVMDQLSRLFKQGKIFIYNDCG